MTMDLLSAQQTPLILGLIIKSRSANEISFFLAIVSLRFLAVGFSTVYGIVICYPLIASIQCITRQNF